MLPHASAPVGDADDPGQVHYCSGTPPPDNRAPPHDEIAKDLGILDFARASKVSGSGFWIFRGAGAQLQRALIQWMLDFQVREHGYREFYLPALVTETAMTNAAKLPKFAGDSYAVDNGRLWLSPTAEVALSEYHAGETLDAAMLPAKYVAYAAAFRREAGAAGVETRGLRRVRQFDKIELFNVTTPDDSYAALERMRSEAEAVYPAPRSDVSCPRSANRRPRVRRGQAIRPGSLVARCRRLAGSVVGLELRGVSDPSGGGPHPSTWIGTHRIRAFAQRHRPWSAANLRCPARERPPTGRNRHHS